MPSIAQSRERGVEERIQAHKRSETHYNVYNPKSKSAYDVYKSPGGTWYCTCPFATKSNKVGTGNNCKHLQRVLDKENGCGKSTCRVGKLCAFCTYESNML